MEFSGLDRAVAGRQNDPKIRSFPTLQFATERVDSKYSRTNSSEKVVPRPDLTYYMRWRQCLGNLGSCSFDSAPFAAVLGSGKRRESNEVRLSEVWPKPPEKVGPYRIESRLGIGGMGAVYRAYDLRLERPVAIKQVLPESAEDPKARDRLRREARAVASLNHPAIVQIFDIVEREDGDWIVMELVEGQTLHRLVERGRLDLSQGLFLGREVAEGLAEAHSKGIVHRDLKTENVMVTLSGHAKILDFGLAKRIWKGRGDVSISVQGSILGTGRAMSPEQAMGDPIDHRSDLFSLGTLLYELITGKPPFMGSSIFHTLAQVCSDRQVSPRELNDQIPEDLSDLVDRMLEKNPSNRPQSAGEVADALNEIAARLSPELGSSYLPARGSAALPATATGPGTSVERSSSDEEITRERSRTRVISVPGVRPEGSYSSSPSSRYSMGRVESSSGIFIKTLVLTGLIDSEGLSEGYEESQVYELLARHDRLVRDLLDRYEGLEIEKSEGFLLLFERPVDAVRFALDYQKHLATLREELEMDLETRVVIHLGEVFLRENTQQDVTRGAKPLEAEGLAKLVAQRVLEMTRGHQILLTQEAYELARRAMPTTQIDGREPQWKTHGSYRLAGVEGGVPLYEVGFPDLSPFKAPEGDPTDSGLDRTSAVDVHRPPSRPLAWGVAVLALMVLLAWALGERFGQGPPGLSDRIADVSSDRTSLAVLSFRNRSKIPELDWLGTAFAEMIGSELTAGGGLRLIPGESVAELEREVEVPEASTLAPGTLETIQDVLDTDYVVLGTYISLPSGTGSKTLRVEVNIQDTRSGLTVANSTETADESALFDLVADLGEKLREELHIGAASPVEQQQARATVSTDTKAYRLYVQGLETLRNHDPQGARRILEEAVEADPQFALAHSTLSEALNQLGFLREAEESARLAYDNVVGLSQENQLEIKAQYREMAGKWDEAIETYQELRALAPDRLELGFRHVEALIVAGRAAEAAEMIASLKQQGVSGGAEVELNLLESELAYSKLEYERAQSIAARAVAKGRELGISMLEAEALSQQSTALMILGRNEQAEILLQEARQRFVDAGDRNKEADALDTLGLLLIEKSQLEEALELFYRALEIYEDLDNPKGVATVYNNLTHYYQQVGDLEKGQDMARQAYEKALELGDRNIEARYLDTLAWNGLLLGRLDRVEEHAKAERDLYVDIASPSGQAWSYFYLGQVALLRGQLDEAREAHETAIGLGSFDDYQNGFLYQGLGEVALLAGDLEKARDILEKALEYRENYGGLADLANNRLLLARLMLLEGRPAEAEAMARQTAEATEGNIRDKAISAWGLLAETLLAQGREAEARTVLERVHDVAAESQNPRVRYAIEFLGARLAEGQGEIDATHRSLEEVRRELESRGLEILALEASLVQAELEWKATGNRERLLDIARTAESQGLGGFSQRAMGLLDRESTNP